jgi:hypothetical protein
LLPAGGGKRMEQLSGYTLERRSSRELQFRIESTRASTREGVQRATFEAWVDGYTSDKAQLESFYRQRFRPEFLPAFEKWLANKPLMNPQTPATPFAMPEYQLESAARAQELEQKAMQSFVEGEDANRQGDAYVLNSVTVSFVLLFAGVFPNSSGHRFSRWRFWLLQLHSLRWDFSGSRRKAVTNNGTHVD